MPRIIPREEPGVGKPQARICEDESRMLSYSTTIGEPGMD